MTNKNTIISKEHLKFFVFRPSQYKPHSVNQNKVVDYYVDAYEKYKNGQNSWNWAAGLWGPLWTIYRGMYRLAFLFAPFLYLIMVPFVFASSSLSSCASLFAFSFVFMTFFWGFFGNRLYFKFIEKRYKKGYVQEGVHPVLVFISFLPLVSLPIFIIAVLIENKRNRKKIEV